MNHQNERPLSRLIILLILTAGLAITLFPFLYMVSTALKGQVFIFEYPPRLIPARPTLQNFITAWTANRFGQYFLNSVVVTIAVTGLVLVLSSLMAFAFARFEFHLKRMLYGVILLLMMIPAMTLIVPQFMLATRLHLLNSLWGLIVVYTAQNLPLNTFLLRGFFEQIPVELEEAARIDGASSWHVYRRIILPLSKPALATVAIFSSLGAWDEYVWAMTILNQADKRTLPVGIAAFHGVHATDWGLVFAASLIATAPILLLFILLQKYFIKGAITGALKG